MNGYGLIRSVVAHSVLLLAILLSGCSSTPESRSYGEQASYDASKSYEASLTTDGFSTPKYTGRYIVRSASAEVIVEDVAEAAGQISRRVAALGGYIEQSNLDDDQSASIQVKVYENDLEPFVEQLASLGEIRTKHLSADDVTSELIDLEAKLKNLVVIRDRFRALLNKAENIADIMEIEQQIARLQYEIDALDGRAKNLNTQARYADVKIQLKRKKIYGPVSYIAIGIWWAIEKLFVIE